MNVYLDPKCGLDLYEVSREDHVRCTTHAAYVSIAVILLIAVLITYFTSYSSLLTLGIPILVCGLIYNGTKYAGVQWDTKQLEIKSYLQDNPGESLGSAKKYLRAEELDRNRTSAIASSGNRSVATGVGLGAIGTYVATNN